MEDERTLGQDERRPRREARAGDRDADRARPVAGREHLRRAHVEDDRVVRHRVDPLERGLCAEELAAVQLDDPLHVRRPRRLRPERRGEEVRELALERGVEAALEADRRRRLRAHRRAAQRAGDVTGEDLDAVAELDEAAQAVEEALGSLLRLDREVRAAGVADEERVAGEDEPRLVAARAVDHREAAVLGTVARRVDRAEDDVADLDLRPVVERLVREGRPGVAVDADRDAVLEREAPVAGDVIGVRVRLEDADEPDAAALGLRQHGLDVVRRVDDDRDAGLLVADEVRGAAQVVVQELLEQHGATLPPVSAMYPKAAPGARARAPRRAAA